MKKLGFGLMRLPQTDTNDPASIDFAQVNAMVDRFLAEGFTYFDTAWMYMGFQSEAAARRCLMERHPRDSFTLATKLHAGFFDDLAGRDRIFEKQREKTGTEYFDYYLLHGIEEGNLAKFEALDCFRWLLDKREAGLIRHAGFSFHGTPETLDDILTRHPEMEFVQLQLNYLDWESPWIQAGKCYETAARHGKQVVVMEPVKGGTLARLPADAEALLRAAAPDSSPASWAIRFAASLENVMVVLSGMSSMAQMEDNTGFMKDFVPLTGEETALLERCAEIINSQIAVACTGCSYCTEGCPMHIAIPQYFSLYNEDMREDLEEKGWTINFTNYDLLTRSFGRASECVACGQCEGVCPQHLPIIETLKKVAAHFED